MVVFVIASLVLSFLLAPEQAKVLGGIAKEVRETIFSLALVGIGLETNFKQVFNRENAKYTKTFLIAQAFNITITLVVGVFCIVDIYLNTIQLNNERQQSKTGGAARKRHPRA